MATIKSVGLRSRWMRRVSVAAGGIALVVGAAWLLLPGLLAQQIEEKASAALGRTVTVREVEVAPWALAVTLHDLKVSGQEGQAPALAVQRIHLNASMTSLLRWAPVLDALEFEQPVARLQQNELGQWDFEDVLHKLQPTSSPQEDAEPVRLALYNIQIKDGRVELDDQVAGVQHTIEALQLQLPFISTLPSQRAVKVQPQLSMRLNGSQLTSEAVSTPFDTAQRTQAKLKIRQLDLAPYAAYVPADVPVRLQQGVAHAEMLVEFDATHEPVVQLQGSTLEVADLQVQDAQGQALAGWSNLTVRLGDTRPLQRQVRLDAVSLQEPFGHLHRRANGDWLPVVATKVVDRPASPLVERDASPLEASLKQEVHTEAANDSLKKIAANAEWAVLIDQFDVKHGWVDWRDDAAGGESAKLRADALQLQARNLAWPMNDAAQWSFSAQLQGVDRVARGAVRGSGQGGMSAGFASLVVEKLDAQALQAYAKQWVRLSVGGLASLNAGIAWQQGRLHVIVPEIAVEAVALGVQTAPQLSWTGLQVRNLSLDTDTQQVKVEHVALEAPKAQVQRDAQGRWMFEQWLQPVVGAPAKGKETVVSASGKPWQVLVEAVELSAGQVELRDAALSEQPLMVRLSDVQLRMQNVDSSKGTAQAQLSARMAERTRRGGWGKPGALSYRGTLQLDPLMAQGKVQIQALPLQAFEPYMAPYMNVRLLRAFASFDGDVQFAQKPKGPSLRLKGQGAIADVHVQTVGGDAQAAKAVQGAAAAASLRAEDLLRWKQLRLQGIDLELQPAQPLHLQVRSTELQDFYARVVVLPEGRLNLQNLLKGAGDQAAVPADEQGDEAAIAVEVVDGEERGEPSARIDMGPITLRDGVIKFSDYFIQPNYTADLTALSGSLDAFSSQSAAQGEAPALAHMTLTGIAQGTAQLLVEGQINPLAQPLALDVRAQVKGLDLSPLTPYSVKYAGHGIEKGKLSMDVHYEVQPDGQLTASNQLVLNQLTFTDPVEGAPASLPVRLAVALLADRNGDIDLDLPISGSLNDPQFRIAPLVFKIIGNIIRKAITAPFSLLTGAFASDDENSDIAFEAGRVRLDEQAQGKLQELAKAMNSKPQLKLTLIGQANSAAELEGWKQSQLDRWVEGEAAAEGEKAKRSEKQKLVALKKAYRNTVQERPRNMLGLAKDLSPAEMEALILKDMVVPAATWQDLAAMRAQVVRDYLLSQGVDSQSIFLGSVRSGSENTESPSVLLNISVQ